MSNNVRFICTKQIQNSNVEIFLHYRQYYCSLQTNQSTLYIDKIYVSIASDLFCTNKNEIQNSSIMLILTVRKNQEIVDNNYNRLAWLSINESVK